MRAVAQFNKLRLNACLLLHMFSFMLFEKWFLVVNPQGWTQANHEDFLNDQAAPLWGDSDRVIVAVTCCNCQSRSQVLSSKLAVYEQPATTPQRLAVRFFTAWSD